MKEFLTERSRKNDKRAEGRHSELPKTTAHEVCFTRDMRGRWSAAFLEEVTKTVRDGKRIASIDPGARVFATAYFAADGVVKSYGLDTDSDRLLDELKEGDRARVRTTDFFPIFFLKKIWFLFPGCVG